MRCNGEIVDGSRGRFLTDEGFFLGVQLLSMHLEQPWPHTSPGPQTRECGSSGCMYLSITFGNANSHRESILRCCDDCRLERKSPGAWLGMASRLLGLTRSKDPRSLGVVVEVDLSPPLRGLGGVGSQWRQVEMGIKHRSNNASMDSGSQSFRGFQTPNVCLVRYQPMVNPEKDVSFFPGWAGTASE